MEAEVQRSGICLRGMGGMGVGGEINSVKVVVVNLVLVEVHRGILNCGCRAVVKERQLRRRRGTDKETRVERRNIALGMILLHTPTASLAKGSNCQEANGGIDHALVYV